MKTIVVNNQKGGVGKTMLAIHLAWFLAEEAATRVRRTGGRLGRVRPCRRQRQASPGRNPRPPGSRTTSSVQVLGRAAEIGASA